MVDFRRPGHIYVAIWREMSNAPYALYKQTQHKVITQLPLTAKVLITLKPYRALNFCTNNALKMPVVRPIE